MKKIAYALAAAALVSGCSGMTDMMSKATGIGVVTQERSTFDNATVVSMTPGYLYAEGSWGNKVRLGARWTSAVPDSVALVLAYESNVSSMGPAYMSLDSVQINIDGDISSYSARTPTDLDSSGYNEVSRTIYTSSRNTIIIPYVILQHMVAAKDCRIRTHTSKGYEDAQFSIKRIPGGQRTAILSIKEEFIPKVDVVRNRQGIL